MAETPLSASSPRQKLTDQALAEVVGSQIGSSLGAEGELEVAVELSNLRARLGHDSDVLFFVAVIESK